MSSPKSPKSALSKIGLGRPRPLRILVLGQAGVGKSALVVRYITRRYIGEYDPCLERVYPHTAAVDGETLALEILDPAGQSHETDSVRLESNIRWADVFVLMYSVTDKCSFDDCNRLKFLINYNKRKRRITSPTSKDGSWEVPVVLVANKKDQVGDRMVATEEGFKRSRDICCHAFHEISVRESIDEVSRVFQDAVRYWREVVKTPKLRRASSDLHDLPSEPQKALHPPVSVPDSPSDSRWVSLMLGVRGRRAWEEETPDGEGGPPAQPFRNRASTDGHLHQRRLYKLRMSLNLRTSNLHERRMSIAMRGATCGF
ncbi:ras-related and estrogen-regulated growth inhibitor-like isoform X1 [Panulirus ornatus]|uniref:ras-related and estrogen-regulated growth inhibitor-like isoform X1 n=1 Tax=Panulirus ornatus TaxID=150431 RepID=UPI003A877F23